MKAVDMPVRVQRKRQKGWRLPPNTVCVDRTSRWGNPFRIGKDLDRESAKEAYRKHYEKDADFRTAVVEHLAGKNLACFCALDQPCHADVLLEWANPK